MYGALADLVLLAHAGFILFAAAGAVLIRRVPRLAWLHLPAVLWGVGIEWSGAVCPLTPLEVWLRRRAGASGYESGFIEHYVTAVIYPAGLTRGMQAALGGTLLLVNVLLYWRAWSASRGRYQPGLNPALHRERRVGQRAARRPPDKA